MPNVSALPASSLHPALSQVSALVLAGGLGSRLRPVVADVPKVLAPVRGRPYLAWLLDQLADAGITHVVLCTGYRGDLVQAAFGNRYRTLSLDYSQEESPLGTGGALRLALPLARSATILAMNGDSYCDVDLPTYYGRHSAGNLQGSLLLTEVADTSRYGRVEVAPDGRIAGFQEKGAAQGRGWINAGVYLLSTDWLGELPTDQPISLERDLLPCWIPRGLGSFACPGRFIDIGTPESFAATEAFFAGLSADADVPRAAAG